MSGAERKALKNELKALQRRQTGFAESAPACPSRWNTARRMRSRATFYAGRDRDTAAQIAALYDRLRAPENISRGA